MSFQVINYYIVMISGGNEHDSYRLSHCGLGIFSCQAKYSDQPIL